MLRHFQPFMDYKKLIELQASQESYRLNKSESIKFSKQNRKQSAYVKVLKIVRK